MNDLYLSHLSANELSSRARYLIENLTTLELNGKIGIQNLKNKQAHSLMQKFTIFNRVGFVGFVGFNWIIRQICQELTHFCPLTSQLLRATSSFATRVRTSSSLFPAIRAALIASTSSEGQPTARGPRLTGFVQSPWGMRR